MIELIVLIIIVIVVLCALASVYNTMVTARNRIDEEWRPIDDLLQRRSDYIPQLVDAAVRDPAVDRESIGAVTAARVDALAAVTPEEKMVAGVALDQAIDGLFTSRVAQPDAAPNDALDQIEGALAGIEDQISILRQSYNKRVLEYNNTIETFPCAPFATVFQFKPRAGFEDMEAERAANQSGL